MQVPVYRHRQQAGYAVVDDDMSWLLDHRWTLNGAGYAQNHHLGFMHRLVVGLPKKDPRKVDHRDRDRLNNQRSNLRITDTQGNGENSSSNRGSTSRFRGVSYDRASGKWKAYGKRKGEKQVHLGYFTSEDEAAKAAADWRLTNMPMATS